MKGRAKVILAVVAILVAALVVAVPVMANGDGGKAPSASLEEIDNALKAEGVVNPVIPKVQELKAKGMSDGEIVAALEEIGMGWYPETGATWVGTKPAPEEAQSLPPREYPFKDRVP